MLVPRWVFLFACLLAEWPLAAQIPLPHRNKPKVEKAAGDTIEVMGILRSVDAKLVVLEAQDTRILSLKRTETTKFLKNSTETEASSFRPGDHLTVETTRDEQGYLYAVEVIWTKAGTSESGPEPHNRWKSRSRPCRMPIRTRHRCSTEAIRHTRTPPRATPMPSPRSSREPSRLAPRFATLPLRCAWAPTTPGRPFSITALRRAALGPHRTAHRTDAHRDRLGRRPAAIRCGYRAASHAAPGRSHRREGAPGRRGLRREVAQLRFASSSPPASRAPPIR